jgi:FlaA1/EpsC-like NDP-sugar epimerase
VGTDVEVEIVGMRPGEKLYEELYDECEARQATDHPKIMVADSVRRRLVEVIHDVNRLEAVVHAPNEFVRQALFEIVPQHTSAGNSARQAA